MALGMKIVAASAIVAVLALAGSCAADDTAEVKAKSAAYDALENYIGSATNFNINADVEPLLEVLEDEINAFVNARNDGEASHKLVDALVREITEGDDTFDSYEKADKFQSFEAFSGMMDVVGVPHGEAAKHRRQMTAVGGGAFAGGVMIPPGTFVAGSPFVGLNKEPATAPLPQSADDLPLLLQQKFDEFYGNFCLQAGINADAGAYNFPGFSLGQIEIEVSHGGCIVDKASSQLVCDSGFIAYSKTPAALNGFSKTGMIYEGSFCPPITLPKADKSEFATAVGGFTSTVFTGK